jgi:hypothetical protein
MSARHEDGLIGELTTVSIGEDDVVRDVTIETHDEAFPAVVDAVKVSAQQLGLSGTCERS